MKYLGNGLYFFTQEEIIDDQIGWDHGDTCKTLDYNTSLFWLVTNCGLDPQGFDTEEGLMQHLSKL